MESLTPEIFVHDMNATIAFYTMLGFKVDMSVPEKPPHDWVMMSNGNAAIMFATFVSINNELPDIKRTNGGSMLLYVKMKNIRKYFESLKETANVVAGLARTVYGSTEFSLKDCNDYILTFAEFE